jgi:hypothetical protein
LQKVLIVAKTHMASGACVSGLTAQGQSIRLIPPGRLNNPQNTEFEVGQVWDIDFSLPDKQPDPPHTEDVYFTRRSFLRRVSNMRETLLKLVQPWQGGPESLYDGMLTIDKHKCYIAEGGAVPDCSTGYWIPDRPLTLTDENDKQFYQVRYHDDSGWRSLAIKFVGFDTPIPNIPAGTLVRVSLARWFMPTGATESRCYLQISGWYL